VIKIVTHTRGTGLWIDQCVKSVEAARVPNMSHDILMLTDPSSHAYARWAALQSADFVGFVDDDDVIIPGAIERCMSALQATGAGVAFTGQLGVDANGAVVSEYHRARFLKDAALNPQAIHHFSLIRRDALCAQAIAAAVRIGVGVDWLCKANAAMRMGAVHVPMIGYHWRIHQNQESVRTAKLFEDASDELTDVIFSWMKKDAPIPVYRAC
jgi:glycosyltransferase involved in cell wall biosynthesis